MGVLYSYERIMEGRSLGISLSRGKLLVDQGTKPAQGHSPLRILRLEGGRLQAIPFALYRDNSGKRGIKGG